MVIKVWWIKSNRFRQFLKRLLRQVTSTPIENRIAGACPICQLFSHFLDFLRSAFLRLIVCSKNRGYLCLFVKYVIFTTNHFCIFFLSSGESRWPFERAFIGLGSIGSEPPQKGWKWSWSKCWWQPCHWQWPAASTSQEWHPHFSVTAKITTIAR